MTTGLLPSPASLDAAPPTDPQEVVEAFLAALAASDLELALGFVAPDLEYVNVGMPVVRGRERLRRMFRPLNGSGIDFEVYLHAISAEGPVVLTERTDVISRGRFRAQFWVCGRFDVHDGKIVLWRDAFDYVDIVRSLVRGALGVLIPSLRPVAPTTRDAAPGR